LEIRNIPQSYRSFDRGERDGRKMTKGGLDDSILKWSESQSRLATVRSSTSAISIPSATVKLEKKVEEIYSKYFGGEYNGQQEKYIKVGLLLDLSSENNSFEEDPISTSLKDKPIFVSAGSWQGSSQPF
jgi:hypothetical protein